MTPKCDSRTTECARRHFNKASETSISENETPPPLIDNELNDDHIFLSSIPLSRSASIPKSGSKERTNTADNGEMRGHRTLNAAESISLMLNACASVVGNHEITISKDVSE